MTSASDAEWPASAQRPPPSTIALLFSPKGRVNRETYIMLPVFGGLIVLEITAGIVLLVSALGPFAAPVASLAILGVFAVAAWSEIAIAIKRLHDIGRPAWHWLLLLIPLYNLYLGLVLAFKPGTIGANEYGADPLHNALSEAESQLTAAYRYEMAGDWDRAVALYKSAAENLHGKVGGEYAINSLKRTQEKMKRAGWPVSAYCSASSTTIH